MNQETRNCQNCKKNFVIEPEDFQFYERIKVPSPTFCPDCRSQRRMAFFNITNLYKRACDLCKKEYISMYSPEAPYRVYCPSCWWGDGWDFRDYARDYDFQRPFFNQFNDLLHEAPLLGTSIGLESIHSSPYNNHVSYLKNCYLLFLSDKNDDSAYGFNLINNKDTFDSSNLQLCEAVYDMNHAYKTFRSFGCWDTLESINCYFMRDSENCQDCFASANLRKKKYYIFNRPYSKEDYFNEIKKWDLGSYKTYREAKRLAAEHWKKFPPMPIYELMNVNSSGNRIYETKNVHNSFEVGGVENGKYLIMIYQAPVKDCYDIFNWGNNMSLCYESGVVGENSSNLKFCNESGINLYNAEYCKLSTGGKYHFGCVGAKKGNYCILNKPYSEEEYNELRKKIMKQMDEMPYTDNKGNIYKYGEFFPPEISPHAYNESIADKFFPLNKNEAEEGGWRWRDEDKKTYEITMPSADLPDHIKEATDSVLKEILGCSKCGRGFKIANMELSFLRKMNLPLPRNCPFCRIGEKFNDWVKESRLIRRICGNCGAEFETPHTEQDYPNILCKKCWLKEVI